MKNYNPLEIEPKWPCCAKAAQGKQNNSYNPQVIEKKWQTIWEKIGLNKTDLKGAKKPFYNLMMYPYPSAEGLHVGNVYAFTGADIFGRYKKMTGFDVFEPIGFDSGGIHSENYAIKVGVHPKIQVPKNIEHFRKQLHQIGCMYDWDHTVDAMDPNYYKWTQWIFVQLFKAGLAYKKKASVTWCPSCKTTLSDEQTEKKKVIPTPGVELTVCERCKTEITKKELEQWFFRITKYAERLLENTKKLDWTEKVLLAQRNWIGKSEGINIEYEVVRHNDSKRVRPSRGTDPNLNQIEVFTTRPDTNFGATFIVLAPEHPFVTSLLKLKTEIENYVKIAKSKSEMERIAEDREKTGVFTGVYCLNKLNNKKLPIFVSDFVLGYVGTGAVIGVPGHDLRDFQFAKKFDLPIIRVVVGSDGDTSAIIKEEQVQEKEGTMVNSDFLNGMDIHKATKKVMDYLEAKGWGKRATIYKLRDWCISRQRYWGPPIPMVHCPHCAKKGISWYDTKEAREFITRCKMYDVRCKSKKNLKSSILNRKSSSMAGWYPVPEDQLPVLLPDTNDYLPGEAGGKAPLARLPEFVKTKCPHCGSPARRETDVSDTFLDSSWYFLRYPSVSKRDGPLKGSVPYQENLPFDPEITKKWLPVSQYTGGAEHSVLHLLYSRFITMVLRDLGCLEFSRSKAGLADEPFPKFYAHGLIIKDGAKMSKSRGNIVNPDEYIEKFGADALRMYLMFLGPWNQGGDFRDTGMIGMYKFLGRVWRLVHRSDKGSTLTRVDSLSRNGFVSQEEAYWVNKTIKKVGEDITKFKYNTAIAAIMEFVNYLAESAKSAKNAENAASAKAIKSLILVLASFAPHLAEELWFNINIKPKTLINSVHSQPWPSYDPKLCKKSQIVIVIQVSGKVRDKITANSEQVTVKEEIVELARKSPKIQKYLEGKKIKKTIFVAGKLVNFVI